MGTLMLFPWLKSSTEYSIGDFVLHPYVRGEEPFGEGTTEQEKVDQALRPYVERGEAPIDNATILSFTDRGILDDVSEEERNEVLMFSELLAASAMAQRKFFDFPTHYCNRTLFELEIWSRVSEGAWRIASRRRDGLNLDVVFGKAFRKHRPSHAHDPNWYSSVADFLDENLMTALLDAKFSLDGGEWSRFFDSIVNFNLANTDSPEPLYSIVEPIMLASAFQRLLDCGSGRREIARAFAEALPPKEGLPVEECSCLPEEVKQRNGVQESGVARAAWMREFYRIRSALAHGEQEDEEELVWTQNQHLLLASYAFPLLLKLELAKAGYYVRTDEDWLKIDLFETLICTPDFDKEDEEGRFPWRQILANERIGQIFVRALENQ